MPALASVFDLSFADWVHRRNTISPVAITLHDHRDQQASAQRRDPRHQFDLPGVFEVIPDIAGPLNGRSNVWEALGKIVRVVSKCMGLRRSRKDHVSRFKVETQRPVDRLRRQRAEHEINQRQPFLRV